MTASGTTVETAATVAPEVAAIRAQLDLVPPDWMNDRLEESAVRRATLQAMHRELGTRAAMHEVTGAVAAEALAKVAAADLSGLDGLIDAQLRKDAAIRLRERLTVPPIDPGGLALAFEVAGAALKASDDTITVPAVSLDGEMAAWRALCRSRGFAFDPPAADDLSRAASRKAAPLAAESDAALQWRQEWLQWIGNPTLDHLGLLAAAAGAIAQRADLAVRVADVRKLIGSANEARVRAGLVWTADRAIVS